MPARYKKKSISKLLQRQVWAASFGDSVGKAKCLCCGMTDITQLSFVCGHIIAEANGGETSVNNMRAICMSCNQSMRTRSMLEFMESHSIDTTRILNTLRNTADHSVCRERTVTRPTYTGRDFNESCANTTRVPLVPNNSVKNSRATTFRKYSSGDMKPLRHTDAIKLALDICNNRGAQAAARIAPIYFCNRESLPHHIKGARANAYGYLADRSKVVQAVTLRTAFHELCGVEADPMNISPKQFNAAGLTDKTFAALISAFKDTGRRRPTKPETSHDAHEFFGRLLRRLLGGTEYACVQAEKTRSPPSAGRKIRTTYSIDKKAICRILRPKLGINMDGTCEDEQQSESYIYANSELSNDADSKSSSSDANSESSSSDADSESSSSDSDSESSSSDADSESSSSDADSESSFVEVRVSSNLEAQDKFAQFRCTSGQFYESLENTRKAFSVSPPFANSSNIPNSHLLGNYSPYFNNNALSRNALSLCNNDSIKTMPTPVPRPTVRFI